MKGEHEIHLKRTALSLFYNFQTKPFFFFLWLAKFIVFKHLLARVAYVVQSKNLNYGLGPHKPLLLCKQLSL